MRRLSPHVAGAWYGAEFAETRIPIIAPVNCSHGEIKMATDREVFDRHIGDWTKALETPWSKMRYRLVHRNIRRHLPEANSIRVLDAGGGNGLDSLPFAEDGNRVTLVDYSEQMLAEA